MVAMQRQPERTAGPHGVARHHRKEHRRCHCSTKRPESFCGRKMRSRSSAIGTAVQPTKRQPEDDRRGRRLRRWAIDRQRAPPVIAMNTRRVLSVAVLICNKLYRVFTTYQERSRSRKNHHWGYHWPVGLLICTSACHPPQSFRHSRQAPNTINSNRGSGFARVWRRKVLSKF